VAFHKRTCFDHEREWRCALYQDARPDCHGCNINFDLNELVGAVYVGPRVDQFFFEVVGSVMEKFQLNKPLQRSTLLQAAASKYACSVAASLSIS
jgi:tRNA G26 N,N-dimethylase Trm1